MFRHFAKVIFGAALLSWCSASAELPEPPGPAFEIPAGKTGEGVPSIASWTDDAGPDETFLLFGDGLTDRLIVWGVDPASPAGREVKPKIQFATRQMMAATLPERAYDGIFVSVQSDLPVAFQIDDPDSTAVLELNSIEGISGGPTPEIVPLLKGGERTALP